MKNFKQWIADQLFDLLSKLSKTEQPTIEELRASAREEVQRLHAPQIWIDPTVRSYPQQEPKSAPLNYPTGTLARGWHGIEVTGVHPTITGVLRTIKPVRTNTEPIDMEKDFPAFLNSVPKEPTFVQAQAMLKRDIADVPTARDIAPDPLNTDEYPAVVKLLHQDREQRRHAS